ncbi:MAG TPA: hypothetical protein VFF40_05580 [Acidimicrobiia bacterium]|nr:hypothetical protein [Acidimicrobiia bacterium]
MTIFSIALAIYAACWFVFAVTDRRGASTATARTETLDAPGRANESTRHAA